ncbi:hypothetical protein AAFF_G00408610 [Aldrovandia affinis]|uniref:Uncharacterized protein n=1 Tax=Aldrovandia affinis TaxID=143900 RepID=A0AAD7SE87_9TELE|nr:hypothetical protein AAFF_G00408610 [Aldrovandia affinis]
MPSVQWAVPGFLSEVLVSGRPVSGAPATVGASTSAAPSSSPTAYSALALLPPSVSSQHVTQIPTAESPRTGGGSIIAGFKRNHGEAM